AAVAVSLALVLPTAFAPLATGAFWGLVCSLLAELPRKLFASEPVLNGRRNRIAIAGILAMVVCGLARLTFAEPVIPQTPPNAAPSAPRIERVLIPVDSSRQPVGTKYYLSERFLRELLGSASDRDQ